MNHLKGMHHVSAITSSAEENYKFYKCTWYTFSEKTVHQDDIQTYHLFFADDVGCAEGYTDYPFLNK